MTNCDRMSLADLRTHPVQSRDAKMTHFNVIVLGDSDVGKSSLIQRFTNDSFSPVSPPPTIGVECRQRIVPLEDQTLRLQIFDTQGQERRSIYGLTASYYRRAHAVVLIYDVTDETSFTGLGKWINEMTNYVCEGAVKLVVGNKAEKGTNALREVSTERGKAFAKEFDMDLIEASAKDGVNTEEVIRKLATRLVEMTKPNFDPCISLTELSLAVNGRKCC